MDEDMSVQTALQQATTKLRNAVTEGQDVLAPGTSEPIYIDPVMQSFFGIQAPDGKTAEKVDVIQNWLKDNNRTDPKAQTQALRLVLSRLGQGGNTSEIDKIYNYVTLRLRAKTMQQQAEALVK